VDRENASGFRHSVHELDARRVQSRRVAELREGDQRTSHLRRRVDALRGVDAYREAIDQRVELTTRQSPQDVSESMARGRWT
jgi:hypothetical protein